MGRRLTRRDYTAGGALTGAASWRYDGAANGLGQLQRVGDTESGYAQVMTYDRLGRPAMYTDLTVSAGVTVVCVRFPANPVCGLLLAGTGSSWPGLY